MRATPLVCCLLLATCSADSGLTVVRSERLTAATASSSPATTPGTATTPASTPGTTPASTPSTTPGTATGTDPFGWKPFAQDVTDRIEEGTLTVPLDYDNPSGPTVELYMLRHKADSDRRIGTLLVNPGGPGFGGSLLANLATQVYSPELVERFDIIGWDPRGTGLSTPAIDCFDDDQYDHFYANYDITPDDDAEKQALRALAKELADGCATRNREIIQHIGTNDSARDMDAIRRALGEDKISYFGFSYGSELGATWATLFPDTVRAAVLDGAADPNATALESALQQTQGFEGTLRTYLAQCSADAECPFHNDGNAEAAYDALMVSLDAKPIVGASGRPLVDRGVAAQATAQAMYGQYYWPQLSQALADAEKGDGSGLLALFDAYFERSPDGEYENGLEAFQSISCMDIVERPTVEQEDAEAAQVRQGAPRMAPGTTGAYFCTFFPKADQPRVDITGKGAGPIVVIGTTGDPATPLASSRKMAESLEDGRFVTVKADQHTGYDVNACSRSTVDQYLLDPERQAPGDGKVCN